MALLDTSNGTWDSIRRELERLRTSGRKPGMFGEEAHGYRLNPPLPEEQVASFEARYRVRLPTEYREFLLRLGNGGAGPYYGLFKLGEMDEGSEHGPWGESVGDLAKPFPHCQAWNDRSGCPEETQAADEEAYERALTEFEEKYFSPHVMDGAIPICHLGCAIRHWLVVSGPESGNVWCDDRASEGGIRPLQGKDGGRVTFSVWYRQWLDEALAKLRTCNAADRKQFWLVAGLLALGCLIALFLLPAARTVPLGVRTVIGVASIALSIAVAWLAMKKTP